MGRPPPKEDICKTPIADGVWENNIVLAGASVIDEFI